MHSSLEVVEVPPPSPGGGGGISTTPQKGTQSQAGLLAPGQRVSTYVFELKGNRQLCDCEKKIENCVLFMFSRVVPLRRNGQRKICKVSISSLFVIDIAS